MSAYETIGWMALGSAGFLIARAWIRYLLARQTAQDAATLATYRLGHSHRSAACAAPYDQSKVAQWQRRENAKAGRARRKSRKVQEGIQAQPVKVAMRRVK